MSVHQFNRPEKDRVRIACSMRLQSLLSMVSFNLAKFIWKGLPHNIRLMRIFHLIGFQISWLD